jgi:hypothetical protein
MLLIPIMDLVFVAFLLITFGFRGGTNALKISSTSKSILSSTSKPIRLPTDPSAWTAPKYRKPLHWVFKITSLESSLNFFELFGLKVFRHEEFSNGCEATCNGPYEGAWSKTMVGDGENEAGSFSLELTYNYGLMSYGRGNDLRYIVVDEDSYVGPIDRIQYSEGDRFRLEE